MGGDPATIRPEIEELDPGPRGGGAGRGGGVPGAREPGGRAVRRWLPALALGGLALLIVGAGVLGPRAATADGPDRGTGTASPVPPDHTDAPATAVPVVRAGGDVPADPFVLLGGRWLDLATGTVDTSTACELEPPLVLAGGRIVCVAQSVNRPPGSTRATYDLAVVEIGRARSAPAAPWFGPPARPADQLRPPAPLRSLSGRRDLAIGDPVAIALATGVEPSSLLLAWAVLEGDGYHVGLDRYRVGDAGVVELGSREVFALPLEDGDGPTSLADLAVSVAPDGRAAMLGVSLSGAPAAPSVRHLAVLGMDAGAMRATALGRPVVLPAAVTSSAAGPAAVTQEDGTTCGGASGEGWATSDVIFLVCPGRPPVFRRIAIRPASLAAPASAAAAASAAAPLGPGDSATATVLDEIAFTSAAGADSSWLDGNGVVIDRARGRYYRWSPSAGVGWAIDLGAPGGSQPVAASIHVSDGGAAEAGSGAPAEAHRGARQVLALDAARDILYLLVPDPRGTGARIEAVGDEGSTPRGAWTQVNEPYAAMALSPDGRLLYLATPPRAVTGAAQPAVAMLVMDAESLAERLFAGRLAPGAWDATWPVVVR